MNRDNQDLYYHGGLGEENRRNDGPGRRDREDFGRAYNRWNEEHARGNQHTGNYQHRDYDTGNSYHQPAPVQRHYAGNSGLGVSSFGGSSYAADRNQQPWERGRNSSRAMVRAA